MFEIQVDAPLVMFKLPTDDGEVEFGIPPMDYMPRETLDEYKKWVRKNNRTASEDDANLKLIELTVDPDVYAVISVLPPAVAKQITEHLAEVSKATQGESGASTSS